MAQVLDERKKMILRAVVERYVANAEPVSSKCLVEENNWPVSSATVRHEMALLEEMGYLTHPHTSAGRVPTDLGYRFFVDSLIENQNITESEAELIRRFYASLNYELDELMKETSYLLSELTQYAAVVFAPDIKKDKVKHIDLITLSYQAFLVVLITSSGSVSKRVIKLDQFQEEDLKVAEQLLNDKLRDLNVSQIKEFSVAGNLTGLSSNLTETQKIIVEESKKAIVSCLNKTDNRVYFGGTANLLNQPEFESLKRLQNLLNLIEYNYSLLDFLNYIAQNCETLVSIGSESQLRLEGLSLVAARYSLGKKNKGVVGILGPTRMNYPKIIPTVRYIAKNLQNVLKNYGD